MHRARPCTNDVRFVDTNVLIYAVSPDPQEADKRRRAQELLHQGGLTLSVQVLQEFYHQVTRPNRTDPLTGSQAMQFLESIDSFPVLNSEQDYDGLRVIDPFQGEAGAGAPPAPP